jgi:peptidylprolyl isomerase domain and WD repeat-containing protein 1
MAASANPILQVKEVRDPTLFCTAFKRPRFYMFTRQEPEYASYFSQLDSAFTHFLSSLCRENKGQGDRDVFNEKPTREEQTLATTTGPANGPSPFAQSAVIHTTMGDIHMTLFPQHAPKAVENFVGHARNGYFENVIVHRVIKKFVRLGRCFIKILSMGD